MLAVTEAARAACCTESSSPARCSASEKTPSRLRISKKPANTASAMLIQYSTSLRCMPTLCSFVADRISLSFAINPLHLPVRLQRPP